MIRDITIGQYFPGDTLLHRMDPRAKLLLTIAYIALLFCIFHPLGYVVAAGFTFLLYVMAHVPLRMLLKNLKPVVPVLIFTGILNLFFVSSGSVIVQWGVVRLTTGGVQLALTMAFRILLMIAGASILTYTTLPIALTDGIENLLLPLKKVRFPAHELAMMITIALRFIPTLLEETQKIMSAQKARGADMETGGIVKRAKALIPILIPLFVSAFRRAEELAMAMEARCYQGGEGRTRLKQLRYHLCDLWGLLGMCVFGGGIVGLNLFAPALF